MPFLPVQFNRAGVFSGTTVSVSPSSPFTAGNAVLIGWQINPTPTVSVQSISDGINTYVIGPQSASNGGTTLGYAYALSVAPGTPTITLTVTGGTLAQGNIWIEEWSGIAAADVGVGNAAFTGGTGSPGQSFDSGSFVTTSNSELIWGFSVILQGTARNPGSGFTTNTNDVATTGYQSEYQVQSLPGSIAVSFTTAASFAFNLYAVGTAFQAPIPPPPPNLIGIASCEW